VGCYNPTMEKLCKCHGLLMYRNGSRNGRQEWACRVQRNALNAQRLRSYVGGVEFYEGHIKDPEILIHLRNRLAEFRTQQADEYREFSNSLFLKLNEVTQEQRRESLVVT
jgi:hypothetical protein